MSVVPITSEDLKSSEVAWFSALCSDDYQFLGVPDGSLRSNWAPLFEYRKNGGSSGLQKCLMCPSSYQVGQDTLSFVAGCAPITKSINLLSCSEMRRNAADYAW